LYSEGKVEDMVLGLEERCGRKEKEGSDCNCGRDGEWHTVTRPFA
jgi:hypothetical protein